MELNLTTNEAIQKTVRFDKTIFGMIAEDAKKEERSFNVQINRLLREVLRERLKNEQERESQAS